MGYAKKTKKQKSAIRSAQNSRYRDKKAQQGLKSVTVFVPINALEQVGDMRKIGLVVTEEETVPLVVKMGSRDGKPIFEVIEHQGNLFLQSE